MSTTVEQQNKVIIALLARSTLGVEQIDKIVRKSKKKGDPDDFVRAYNALDGTKTIPEIAKIVGITPQGMGHVLQTWEEEGIVYDTGASGRTAYNGLLKLPLKSKERSTETESKVDLPAPEVASKEEHSE